MELIERTEKRVIGDGEGFVRVIGITANFFPGADGDRAVKFMKDALSGLEAAGVNNVILNAEGMMYVNSSAIGVIVDFAKRFKARGGALKLVTHSGTHFRRDLQLAKLDKTTVIQICENEDEAIAAFSK